MPGIGIGITPQFGGGKFSPNQLSNLIAWYRSDTGTEESAGDPAENSDTLQFWRDRSSLARDLTQATGTKRPPWSATGAPNGHPYVGPSDNVDDFLRITFTQASPVELFLICLPSVSDAANGTVIDGQLGNVLRVFVNNATQIGAHGGAGNLITTCDTNVWNRIRVLKNGASSELQVGDAAAATGLMGSSNVDGLILFLFGDQVADPADANIAEVILYGRALTAAERAQVNGYLKARYGI